MTSSDPNRYDSGDPSPEHSATQHDPNAPVDYPTDAGLPPPVYPPPQGYPPGYAGYSPGPQGYPGYPGAPGYHPGAGYDPYRPVTPPGTNGKAVAALVSSLVGMLCCGLPAIAGLILGVMGMRETKRTGQDGYAMALIGAIIGGLVVAGWLLYLVLSVGLYASGWQWAP